MKARLHAIFYAFLMAGATAPDLFAAAPMVKTQAPGFYRTMVGAIEVTVIGDGTVDLPMDKLLAGDAVSTTKTLQDAFLKVPVETSVNTFLINTGTKLVLIDSGAGELFGPTLGKFVANLKAAGYEPSQIDEVYITHMHPDHIGGLANKGAAAFPNAIVRAHDLDAKFWLSKDNLINAPQDKKDFFKGAQASLQPYIKAGKFKAFSKDEELVPGVKAQPTLGHTAGHTSYLVESQGQKLLLLGDLIHVASVQFSKPETTIAFDSDAKAAKDMRLKVFNQVAKDKVPVAAAHLPFPGMGHIVSSGTGFQWVPINYSRLN